MLKINTFGELSISDGQTELTDVKLNSVMLGRLLVYMVINRDKILSTDEISSALWQKDETDNPTGALKNLMYRLRKVLKKTFGDADYIISHTGTYCWNNEIETVVDVDLFNKYIEEADCIGNADPDEAITKYESAIELYVGDFMPKYADIHWIISLNTYYHSLYINVVKKLSELYMSQGRYEQLEKLCNEAITVEHGDEQIYCYLIRSRIRMKQIKLAFESYHNACSIMAKEIGIKKTPLLNDVYEELLAMDKGNEIYGIESVKEDINDDDMEGVFFCGYPVFKEIYHLEVRKGERMPVPQNLLFITIYTFSNEAGNISEYRISKAMEALKQVLHMCLRVGDVAARYSESQYIILLPTCTKESAEIVANRIKSKFKSEYKNFSSIQVKIDIEPVFRGNPLVE